MAFWQWSMSPNANATADPTINWQYGMAPSAVSPSSRIGMARLREFGNDISGSIVTAGTSTAYTLSSNQVFTSLSGLGGQMLCFCPHVTNGAGPVTIAVDGLSGVPLRSAPNAEIQAGTLIQGTPYCASYNASDGAMYLQGFYGNPYSIPVLGGFDHWDTIAPNSSFIFPMGQAISRTTYATAFARWGTRFGVGDGSTTFNVPDKSGRVSAMIEATATRLTSSYFGGNSTNLGAVGGGESHTLTQNEMPSHFHTASISDPGHTHGLTGNAGSTTTGGGTFAAGGTGSASITAAASGVRVNSSNGLDTVNNAGGGTAHAIVQPTICCNYVIRII